MRVSRSSSPLLTLAALAAALLIAAPIHSNAQGFGFQIGLGSPYPYTAYGYAPYGACFSPYADPYLCGASAWGWYPSPGFYSGGYYGASYGYPYFGGGYGYRGGYYGYRPGYYGNRGSYYGGGSTYYGNRGSYYGNRGYGNRGSYGNRGAYYGGGNRAGYGVSRGGYSYRGGFSGAGRGFSGGSSRGFSGGSFGSRGRR